MAYKPESANGNSEFKYNLRRWTEDNLGGGASQMNFRLMEGKGIAYYTIGITDSGIPLGIYEEDFQYTTDLILKMASTLSASVILEEKYQSVINISRPTEQSLFKKYNGHIENINVDQQRFLGKFLIKCDNMVDKLSLLKITEKVEKPQVHRASNLNICIMGNVNAGKSTLLGVLISGKLDNGKGGSRSGVFNFKHEASTGRTTSISYRYMIYNDEGEQVYGDCVVNDSHHVVTVFDTCGHEKYFSTTARCIYSSYADYCFVLIEAKAGITEMTKEHIHLVSSSGKRLVIVITQVDGCPEATLDRTRARIRSAFKRCPVISINSEKDIDMYVENVNGFIPIIETSSVSGHNIDILRKLIRRLPILRNIGLATDPLSVVVDRVYMVHGIGKVVSGYVKSGSCRVNDNIIIGPNKSGQYLKGSVKSIYYIYHPTDVAKEGQMCTFALSKIGKCSLSRGMLLLSQESNPSTVRTFSAKIKIVGRHSTAIKIGYEPSLTINNIDQCARIVGIASVERAVPRENGDESHLYEGDSAEVTFYLVYFPIHLVVNDKFFLREGKSRGHGTVLQIM